MSDGLDHIRNIGILAHVDAGKTTLTERILYDTGTTLRLGEVDDGTATTDFLDAERRRGITIHAAAVSCPWRDHRIHIIDTPGHVDFTVEVERSLRVLDGAVVVLSAVEGVEAQTEAVWRQAQRHGVPCIAFLNKLDRRDADPERVVDEIRRKLHPRPVLVQLPVGVGEAFQGLVDLVEPRLLAWTSGDPAVRRYDERPVPDDLAAEVAAGRERIVDALAEADDAVVTDFVETGEVGADRLRASARRAVREGRILPVLVGSAARNAGVQPLLDAVVDYLPSPADRGPLEVWGADGERAALPLDGPACAYAFKIVEGTPVGRLAFLRVFAGRLEPGAEVWNSRTGRRGEIAALFRVQAASTRRVDGARAGDIVLVAGLDDVVTGDTLCGTGAGWRIEPPTFPDPVMTVAVEPRSEADARVLEEGLRRLCAEDPSLRTEVEADSGRFLLAGMGELHLEVAIERLRERHGSVFRWGRPTVAWREAPAAVGEGESRLHRTVGMRGVFGHARVRVRPAGASGGGVAITWRSRPPVRELQEAVERGVRGSLAAGVLLGHPVIACAVEVVGCELHELDGDADAYELAAAEATRRALAAATVRVLEPVMRVDVATPVDYTGAVVADLNSRRGTVLSMETRGTTQIVVARVPLASLFGYATALRSATRGRATFSMHFEDYAPVPSQMQVEMVRSKTPAP